MHSRHVSSLRNDESPGFGRFLKSAITLQTLSSGVRFASPAPGHRWQFARIFIVG
jgi:hypothetical protein